jgi:Flp pilus assembly secretin CpaC
VDHGIFAMRNVTLLAALASLSPFGAQAGQVWLNMDQVRPYEIQAEAGQIVVGNPAIADVTVQDKKRVLLFGKAPGLTNMYIFDDEGNTIENLVIRVSANNPDMLTMHKGVERVTYNCASNCEATLTVGDSKASFTALNTQVKAKNREASSEADSAE